jgi:hypothetical protein
MKFISKVPTLTGGKVMIAAASQSVKEIQGNLQHYFMLQAIFEAE